MLKSLLCAGAVCALLAGAACATPEAGPDLQADAAPEAPKGAAAAPVDPSAGLYAPSRLIARARALQEKEGCAAAAPTYRVVAGMGAGQEAAQHELGACLLAMTGVSDLETQMFREEALFWLRRAGLAGNARAQRALAVHYGAPNHPDADEAEALRWAYLYAGNAEAGVLGYKALPATFIPGLEGSLGADAAGSVAAAARAFEPVRMEAFEPPAAREVRDQIKRERPPVVRPERRRGAQ